MTKLIVFYRIEGPTGIYIDLTETEARELLHDLGERFNPSAKPPRLSGMDVAHATRRQDLPDYDPAPSIARESAHLATCILEAARAKPGQESHPIEIGFIGQGADVVVLKPSDPPQEPSLLEQAARAYGAFAPKLHPTSQTLLDELRDGGGDAENLAARLDWPEWKASQTAASLVKRGLVEASKLGKRTQYALPLGTQS